MFLLSLILTGKAGDWLILMSYSAPLSFTYPKILNLAVKDLLKINNLQVSHSPSRAHKYFAVKELPGTNTLAVTHLPWPNRKY
jgi:hypothetical protein